MPEPGENKEQNLNSALDLWQEAVEKAGVDLERIVNSSIEQLTRYSEELERSLAQQLKKIAEQAETTVSNNVEELNARKDDLNEKLAEFERTEIEKMVKSSQEAREKIYLQVDKTKQELQAKLADTLKSLSQLSESPAKRFTAHAEKNTDALNEVADSSKERVTTEKSKFETQLQNKSKKLEQQVDDVVKDTRGEIEVRLSHYEEGFDQKIAQVLSQLDAMLESTTAAADQATTDGLAALTRCEHENEQLLANQVNQWQSSMDNMKRGFQEDLESSREEALSLHSRRLTYHSNEAKSSIQQVAGDALARISGTHRMYYSSLKRLERKYAEEINKIFNQLEAIIAEERSFRANPATQPTDETKEKLRSQLQMRGNEVVKTYKRQVEQLERDFARASSSSYERVDSIRLQAVESLEKQVRIIRSELDRIEKLFKQELSQAAVQVPEIEERGRVASMSVSAYLSTMLTLDSD